MDSREIEKICPFCDEVFSAHEIKSHIGVNHLGIPQSEIAPPVNHLECDQPRDQNEMKLKEEAEDNEIPTVEKESKPVKPGKSHAGGIGGIRYQCAQCYQSFAFRQSLTIHIRVKHEGSLTFRCDLCDKNFTKKCGLTRHIKYHCHKSHTNVTLPKRKGCSGWCQTCQKNFGNLRQHVRIVHEKIKFFCGFTSHVLTHHL